MNQHETIRTKPDAQKDMKVAWDLGKSMNPTTERFLNSLVGEYGSGPFTVDSINSFQGHTDVTLINAAGKKVVESDGEVAHFDWYYLRPIERE